MKKEKFLDKIIIAVVLYWIIFIAFSWFTFWVKGSIPDTLIQVGLGGSVLELAFTTLITLWKIKYENHDKEDQEVMEDQDD